MQDEGGVRMEVKRGPEELGKVPKGEWSSLSQ